MPSLRSCIARDGSGLARVFCTLTGWIMAIRQNSHRDAAMANK
jgi:hypothetical protein